MKAISAVLVLAMNVAALAAAPVPTEGLGLSVRADGALVKDGKPYRGIGVNFFDAFYRTLLKPGDTSYEAGFKVLADHQIPFARFMCSGFWPGHMKLYREDKARYFELLDGVVRSAEKQGIGLIPSLFWFRSTAPDLAGEPCDQWGNPQSKTHDFLRTYTREVVARYKASPAIWGWEFGNEYNLDADLPNAAAHRPPVQPKLGTPASRSARDEVSHDMVRTAFAEFAKEVRRHDPHRFITSGNAFPRPSAWHQRTEKSWKTDTPEQYAEMLLADNPDPVNVLSVHAYKGDVGRIRPTMGIAARAKKPLFIGEFGVPGGPSPQTEKEFAEMLATIEREGVPLAALWVFDYGGQDELSVTATNGRAWQLKAVAGANARIRAAERQ